ncbi:MAG: type II toxin-antitoxin system prevent-host-death family antitoxin [Terracidiphilus sp.]
MQTAIGAGEFKAKCLQLLDDVAEQRGTLIITKHGKPVAKLVPVEPEQRMFGALTGSVVEEHDIISPVNADWESSK